MVSRIIVNFAVFVVAFNPGHYSEKGNEDETLTFPGNAFLSYFFVKKIPLSLRFGYVMDGSMVE